MRALIGFALIFLGFCGSVFAGKSVPMFRSGNWEGDAYYDDQGKFQFCMIGTSYQSGISAFFSVTPDGTWQVMFDRPGGFSRAVQQRLDLYIDGRFVFGAPAAPIEKGLILTLPSTANLFQAMRVGHVLKVVTPGGSAGFNLTGTAAALAELLTCTTRLSRPTVAGSAPVASAPAYTPAPSQPVSSDSYKFPRDQVITYTANVLSAADVKNYRILPYEETKVFGDVVWTTPDGTIGGILMFKNATDLDLNEITASISREDGKGCKGDFASGKKAPTYVEGVEIRKSFSICKAGENSSNFEYSLIKMPNGTLVRYAFGRVGQTVLEPDSSGSSDNQRSEAALLSVALPK